MVEVWASKPVWSCTSRTNRCWLFGQVSRVQVVINCRYSVAQMCTWEDIHACLFIRAILDDVMSQNELTTICMQLVRWNVLVCKWEWANKYQIKEKFCTQENPVLRDSLIKFPLHNARYLTRIGFPTDYLTAKPSKYSWDSNARLNWVEIARYSYFPPFGAWLISSH